MSLGKLIVIDGMDGCGKGTQIRLLQEKLGVGGQFIFTREPGGTSYAERIRELILHDAAKNSSPLTQFLLFWASRSDHLDMINRKLAEGKHVISDRFDSSSHAFQIHGGEMHALVPAFNLFRQMLMSHIDTTYIILDLSPEIAYSRMQADAARTQTHFDIRPREYHERVRRGFQDFGEYAHCIYIDADRSPEVIHSEILKRVQEICRI